MFFFVRQRNAPTKNYLKKQNVSLRNEKKKNKMKNKMCDYFEQKNSEHLFIELKICSKN